MPPTIWSLVAINSKLRSERTVYSFELYLFAAFNKVNYIELKDIREFTTEFLKVLVCILCIYRICSPFEKKVLHMVFKCSIYNKKKYLL